MRLRVPRTKPRPLLFRANDGCLAALPAPRAEQTAGRMRQIVALVAKVGVTAALLYLALARTDFSALAARLNRLDWLWFAPAGAVAALQILLCAIRWRRIAQQCEAPLDQPRAFRFMMIATFFNQVLPSTVGGDAMRMWLFAREGAGWSKATYSVLLD